MRLFANHYLCFCDFMILHDLSCMGFSVIRMISLLVQDQAEATDMAIWHSVESTQQEHPTIQPMVTDFMCCWSGS